MEGFVFPAGEGSGAARASAPYPPNDRVKAPGKGAPPGRSGRSAFGIRSFGVDHFGIDDFVVELFHLPVDLPQMEGQDDAEQAVEHERQPDIDEQECPSESLLITVGSTGFPPESWTTSAPISATRPNTLR